jgi:hypothetical protein
MNTACQNRPEWLPHLLWFRHRCPCCGSDKFKTAEMRPFDPLLAMFAIRPVRCMFCWRRFYWFRISAQPAEL